MKNFAATLFLLFTITTLVSQEDWPPTNAWWAYQISSASSLEVMVYHYASDTIYFQKPTKKIKRIHFQFFGENDNLDFITKLEDSFLIFYEDKSIFWNYNNEWRKLYNFDPELNDTYELFGIDSLLCDTSGVILNRFALDSIVSLPLSNNATVHKIENSIFHGQEVESVEYSYQPQYWGFQRGILNYIAPIDGFLPQILPNNGCLPINFKIYDGLSCWNLPGQSSFINVTFCPEIKKFIQGLTTHIESHGHSIPLYDGDPFQLIHLGKQQYKIINPQNIRILSIKIYNSTGRLLESVSSASQSFNLSKLSTGIVNFQILHENGTSVLKTIVF